MVGSTLKLLQKDLLELESEFDEAVRMKTMEGHWFVFKLKITMRFVKKFIFSNVFVIGWGLII